MTISRLLRAAATAPRARRRVLVDGRTPMNYAMVDPIVRALDADPQVRVALTASDEPGRAPEVYAGAPPSAVRMRPWQAACSRWDVYLTSDFMWAPLPLGAARVQVFHGVAGKYGFDAPAASLRDWDRLFFVNERRLRNVVAAGALDEDSPAIRLIGMPKVDALVNGDLRRDDVLRRLALDPARPTVLYAPTWSPESSLNRIGERLVARLAQMPVNLLVKLHDRSCDARPGFSGGVDWRARLAPRMTGPGARLVAGPDITPWLAAADVMITDHSSAGFEYLLLDRPLIRIHLPDLIARARVHPDYVALLAEASGTMDVSDDPWRHVEDALAFPRLRSASRRRIAAELFYRPGTATTRALQALYELMDLPLPVPARRQEIDTCPAHA